jgi:hypothetical protein
MAPSMRVNGTKKEKRTAKEFKFGLMDHYTKVTGKMTKRTAEDV